VALVGRRFLSRPPVPIALAVAVGFLLGLAAAGIAARTPPFSGMSQADREWYFIALASYCRGHGYATAGEPCMALVRDGTLSIADLYAYRTAHEAAR